MRGRWLWVVLFLSLGLNAGVLTRVAVERLRRPPQAAAERAWRTGPPDFARVADRLELEGERRERFIEIQREFFGRVREGVRELELRRVALRREALRPRPDAERLDRLTAETGAAYAELDRAFIDNVVASLELLDRPQKRRFLRFLARLQARAVEHRAR